MAFNSTLTLDISTMFYPSTTIGSIHMSILQYIPQWTWNKRHHRIIYFCFIPGCFVEHRCWWKNNYSIVWQTGWFQFCHCSVKSRIRKGHTIILHKRALFVAVCSPKGTLLPIAKKHIYNPIFFLPSKENNLTSFNVSITIIYFMLLWWI
jgi:hypothetical protein